MVDGYVFHPTLNQQRVYSNDLPPVREISTKILQEALNDPKELYLIRRVNDNFILRVDKCVDVRGYCTEWWKLEIY